MPRSNFGDLVIVIPGILGSRLEKVEGTKRTTVWDLSIRSLPGCLRRLANGDLLLGGGDGLPDDGIEATDLLNYQLLPGYFGVDDYGALVDDLTKAVGRRQISTFPYDWRLSNRHAAERLKSVTTNLLESWKKESGNGKAKLWLVCHSMGGLVARYFCEELDGAKDTRAVITIGTPHRGSVKALDVLINGKKIFPFDLTDLFRSLPSTYELLPLFPVILQGSGARQPRQIAEYFGLDPRTGGAVTGPGTSALIPPPLTNLNRDMLKRALEFHSRIRTPAQRRASELIDSPYQIEAFFNLRQKTPISAQLSEGKLSILNHYPESEGSSWVFKEEWGDGTVPSFSSVPIEWDSTEQGVAVAEKHPAMQVTRPVLDMIGNWLRPADVRGKRGDDPAEAIRLDVPDIISAGQDLEVQLCTAQPAHVSVEFCHCDLKTKERLPTTLPGEDTLIPTTLARAQAGTYRVTARSTNPLVSPVTDYVYVSNPSEG